MSKKTKAYAIPDDIVTSLVAESRTSYGIRSYVSLFSSAGVGCYGFKEAGFSCIATVELLERRLKIQKYNNKCMLQSGYICGDMTLQETKDKVFRELRLWDECFGVKDLDVLIATPPCQGMSVANHKKGDELKRNSLVVESIKITKEVQPKFFIFENVRAFLSSICTDVDGVDRPIQEAITLNLGGKYNILYRVVNFKDYGCPSSRTRTLVIGVRKDLQDITPYDIFPSKSPEISLRQTIGHLSPLKTMGEIYETDIYHSFRKYAPHMEAWISEIKEGQSAFDNDDPARIPHTVKDGVIVYNAQKNSDKYTRQFWDKVAPCVHTRNDILASQNTVHPADNRVFSIRELMLMMSVPESFRWTDIPVEQLNKLSIKEKQDFLKKEEMNIRQNLGEAVPTIIFQQIANKISRKLQRPTFSNADASARVKELMLTNRDRIIGYINKSRLAFPVLSRTVEMANCQRDNTAAYYTRQDVCFAIVNTLPDAKQFNTLTILEPAVGVGNFLPILFEKYASVPSVTVDMVDINPDSIDILKAILGKIAVPSNFKLNFIVDDFLLHNFPRKYDIVIGNPPYMKLTNNKALLAKYKEQAFNKATNNTFAFFVEKALSLGEYVSLIVPKSIINAPEYNATRELLNNCAITHLIDFGEKAFKGVKIETISFTASTRKKQASTAIYSYINDTVREPPQRYITDSAFPYWLLYRNKQFDEVAQSMTFGIFKSYRDRVITKSATKPTGKIRVLKSRNIGNNQIIDIPEYDCYVDNIEPYDVAKYLNHTECVLVPNLTYNPRACFLPQNCIADGSVAILTLTNPHEKVTPHDLAFYASEKFSKFYKIARNLGTRSLNIDNNSVFFFGKLTHNKS
ncbi:MAG: DNA (cytosine-5-)-methyltransferase [Bacteroides sp.]|nr:DNA (cytosine-5-)-methyltransferase [Bacteroides sp.]MCM1379439.1 DNA (cytosine-5-)-methyltransferase [Bacteroides sp.]MCM1445300.1 DNA (cytosine-5-)-methyltransferase [Prevotella sp.]